MLPRHSVAPQPKGSLADEGAVTVSCPTNQVFRLKDGLKLTVTVPAIAVAEGPALPW